MSETRTPELDFLKSGDLPKLLRGDVAHKARIAGSILTGRRRDFTQDAERLTGSMEQANVTGTENIPLENVPIIIACNHPEIYDVVAGVVNVSKAFSLKRQEHNLPKDIHWMVTTKIPQRDLRTIHKPLYGLINLGLKMLDNTYQFISVPQDERSNTTERARSIIEARKYLKGKTSPVVGLFPGGDVDADEFLDAFYNGVGELARVSESSNARILPVGIYRGDEGRLTVEFGAPLLVNPDLPAKDITENIRHAVSVVSHKIP